MIKTLTNLLKQDKEKFVVPKGVQDCIPITAIYDDGIFRVGKDKYSKSFKFTDINYAVASREDKEAMFLEYSELLNSLDSGATTKLTINNRRLNRLDFEKTILIPETGDELDVYREEYNKILLDKATGANAIVQDKYGFLKVKTVKPSVIDSQLCSSSAVKRVEKLGVFKEHCFLVLTACYGKVNIRELETLGILVLAHTENTVIIDCGNGNTILYALWNYKLFFVLL